MCVLLLTSNAFPPFMLSWVIGSRRILKPRFLLAAFVDHFFPFWRRQFVANQDWYTCPQLFHWLCLKSIVRGFCERRILSGLISCVQVEAVVFVVLVTSRMPSGNLRFSDWIIDRFAEESQFKDETFFFYFTSSHHQMNLILCFPPLLYSHLKVGFSLKAKLS